MIGRSVNNGVMVYPWLFFFFSARQKYIKYEKKTYNSHQEALGSWIGWLLQVGEVPRHPLPLESVKSLEGEKPDQ